MRRTEDHEASPEHLHEEIQRLTARVERLERAIARLAEDFRDIYEQEDFGPRYR